MASHGPLVTLMLLTTALAVQAQGTAPSPPQTYEDYMRAAVAACTAGQLAEAEKAFAAALKLAEAYGEGDTRLTNALGALGATYALERKFEAAEPLYVRVLAIYERTPGISASELSHVSEQLGDVYYEERKFA